MFPSRSSSIGNDLPLWAVQDDFKPGVSSVDTFMGGWKKAYAKQYHLGKLLMSVPTDRKLTNRCDFPRRHPRRQLWRSSRFGLFQSLTYTSF